MPYNLDLEYRNDYFIDRFGVIAKKNMFGGVYYLINGNICFGVHKEYLVIRSPVEQSDELLNNGDITLFDITSKPSKNWLMVSPDYVETDEQLLDTLKIGVDFAENLPHKKNG
ncbi:TfoX/Sxy family protein [Chloroflexota bacterium]